MFLVYLVMTDEDKPRYIPSCVVDNEQQAQKICSQTITIDGKYYYVPFPHNPTMSLDLNMMELDQLHNPTDF